MVERSRTISEQDNNIQNRPSLRAHTREVLKHAEQSDKRISIIFAILMFTAFIITFALAVHYGVLAKSITKEITEYHYLSNKSRNNSTSNNPS
ncbi:hypothetical protein GJ496_011375 [Pomphorhynchus laevis]|nr:hypothetical protein GJ496_011375 [Pomphorhynchus laevis]